jgi:predicted ribosome quality control (RQC) complex YloA/Tae2 family protein
LWFHARGVSGSHLIIRRANKKEKIPKNIIEKAASIAAFYSKAKHSKLVPVAYTEKKYVIKRKGMPPGTVQMQKENVVMVEPKNPEQISEVTDEKNN